MISVGKCTLSQSLIIITVFISYRIFCCCIWNVFKSFLLLYHDSQLPGNLKKIEAKYETIAIYYYSYHSLWIVISYLDSYIVWYSLLSDFTVLIL